MKEKLFNIARFCMFAVAIIQLTLSQIHIEIIMKVFADEIGFYLFLFIIFGLVIAFNSVNLKRGKGILLDTIGVVAASLAGYKYVSLILTDLDMGGVLTLEEASLSLNFSILTIGIYTIGLVVILLTKGKRVKDETID